MGDHLTKAPFAAAAMRQEKFMRGSVAYHVCVVLLECTVQDLILRFRRFCDACDKRLRPGDRVYRCLDCWNFDICSECKHPAHQLVTDVGTNDPIPAICLGTLSSTRHVRSLRRVDHEDVAECDEHL